MDELLERIKIKYPDQLSISFADDIVSCGRFEVNGLYVIFEEFSMKLNLKKCVTFNTKTAGISKRSTFTYLGITFHQDGRLWNKTKIEKELKQKTQKLKNLGHTNPIKAHTIWMAMIDSKLKFVEKRFMHRETKTEKDYIYRLRRILRKQLFTLHRGLRNDLYTAFKERCFTQGKCTDNQTTKILLKYMRCTMLKTKDGDKIEITPYIIINDPAIKIADKTSEFLNKHTEPLYVPKAKIDNDNMAAARPENYNEETATASMTTINNQVDINHYYGTKKNGELKKKPGRKHKDDN